MFYPAITTRLVKSSRGASSVIVVSNGVVTLKHKVDDTASDDCNQRSAVSVLISATNAGSFDDYVCGTMPDGFVFVRTPAAE